MSESQLKQQHAIDNPFRRDIGGCCASIVSAAERIECAKSFTYEQCMQALKQNGLQHSVIAAIQTRIRKLARESNHV